MSKLCPSTSLAFSCLASLLTVGCNNTPLEPPAPKKEPPPAATPAATPTPVGSAALAPSARVAGPSQGATVPVSPDDPLKGQYTMADANKAVPGKGALVATIATNLGDMKCKLFDDRAPITVANFVGLATGKRSWKDPTGAWVNKPAYDGTTFHRIIKGFMIQGGDPKGTGSGEPGYVIPDEIWDGAKHDRPGLLCMANRGKNTNGAQFFITDEAAAHLDVGYTIFGECSPVDTVHKIASVKTSAGDKPVDPVTIKSVKIARDANAK